MGLDEIFCPITIVIIPIIVVIVVMPIIVVDLGCYFIFLWVACPGSPFDIFLKNKKYANGTGIHELPTYNNIFNFLKL